MASHHIYLHSEDTSNGIYLNNKCNAFTNSVPPLKLDPSYEYEVGLLNVILPRRYYIIRPHDDSETLVRLKVIVLSGTDESDAVRHDVLYHEGHISGRALSDEHMWLLKRVNAVCQDLLLHAMNEHSKDPAFYVKTAKLVKSNSLFYYHNGGTREERVQIRHVWGRHPVIKKMAIRLPERVSRVLGFNPNRWMTLFNSPGPSALGYNDALTFRVLKNAYAPRPVNKRGDIQTAVVYSDLVNPSRYGSQLVNILDAFSLTEGVARGQHPTVYKPLIKGELVDSVSIKITDQRGRGITFEEGYPVTMLLHIRPRRGY